MFVGFDLFGTLIGVREVDAIFEVVALGDLEGSFLTGMISLTKMTYCLSFFKSTGSSNASNPRP